MWFPSICLSHIPTSHTMFIVLVVSKGQGQGNELRKLTASIWFCWLKPVLTSYFLGSNCMHKFLRVSSQKDDAVQSKDPSVTDILHHNLLITASPRPFNPSLTRRSSPAYRTGYCLAVCPLWGRALLPTDHSHPKRPQLSLAVDGPSASKGGQEEQ